MNDGVNIKVVGDAEIMAALQALDQAVALKYLRAILRDVGNKAVVPLLRHAVPLGPTGNLRASMGVVTGKSKSNAVVFVGPRMSHKRDMKGDRKQGYQGWVANILEFAKPGDRRPANAKAFRPFDGDASGPFFFKKVGPIKKKTNIRFAVTKSVGPARLQIEKSMRTVVERAWNRGLKKMSYGEHR